MTWSIKQKSIFFKLFISYLLIVLLMGALIYGLVFSYTRYNMEEEVIALNEAVLEQYAKIVDALVIDEAEKVVREFTVKTEIVQKLARLTYAGKKAGIPNFAIYQSLREFFLDNINLISAIHLYNPASDTIISSNYGIKPVGDLTPLLRDNLRWIGEQPSAEFSWITGREQQFSVTGEKTKIITYLRRVQLIRSDLHPPVTIAIDIREKDVKALLSKHTATSEETFLLSDGDGAIQFQVNEPLPPEVLQPVLSRHSKGGDKVLSADIGGVKYISSRARLTNGWYLYRLVPLRYFFRATNRLIINTLLIIGFFILGGIVIAYFLSKYFYTAVATIERRILGLIGVHMDSTEENRDEFNRINKALSKIDITLTAYYKEQERKIPRLKSDFIRSALAGNSLDGETYRNNMPLVGAPEGANICSVLLVHFQSDRDSHFNRNHLIQSKMNTLALIEGQSDEETVFIGTEWNEMTLAFLCFSGTVVSSVQENEDFFADLFRLVSEKIDERLLFSFGNYHREYAGIYQSYKEAVQAFKHYFFYPDRFLFPPSLIKGNLDYDTAYFDKQNDLLKKAFHLEHYDDVRQIITQSVSFLISEPYSFIAKELCLNTITQIIIGELFKLKLPDETPIEEQLVRYRSIADIREFGKWCDSLMNLFKLNENNAKKEQYRILVEELKEYIEANLSEDLSLTRLSDLKKLSNGYLSRIFLETAGIPVNEYIARSRMEHARELLMNSEKKIAQIARESGYFTPHYFSKKFKEYYGKTPQGYRLTIGKI